MKVSIIIPVLNEASGINDQLQHLSSIVRRQDEMIVVDGGSDDQTVSIVRKFPVQLINSSHRSRALQMNTGVKVATGDMLVFLHADTRLPKVALELIEEAQDSWGFFKIKLSGKHWFMRIIESAINIRSRITKVATGDQTLFMTKHLFESLGGFAEIPLMEDVEFSKRLRLLAPPKIIKTPVITSSRRWEQKGIIRTIFLMWRLRVQYFLGISPHDLYKKYYG